MGDPDAPLTVLLLENHQYPHGRSYELGGGWEHVNVALWIVGSFTVRP